MSYEVNYLKFKLIYPNHHKKYQLLVYKVTQTYMKMIEMSFDLSQIFDQT